jgi:hypothetical protein
MKCEGEGTTANEVKVVYDEETEETEVWLEDGFYVRFWMTGLSREEYIRRAREIQRLERERDEGER